MFNANDFRNWKILKNYELEKFWRTIRYIVSYMEG